MSRFAPRATWIAVALLLFAANPAGAQCTGSARPLTSETRHYACDPMRGQVPSLAWSFRIDCIDACGYNWVSLPSRSAVATGACTLFPLTSELCMPYFEQYNHSNGLYGVSSAFDQLVFNGCQKKLNSFWATEGSCPCAPLCVTDSGDTTGEEFDGPHSPILISLGDARLELSSEREPVRFDIDGDGERELITWTAAGSDEAFLVLDRDQDGQVDDGRELFGDSSPQLPSAEPNGFRALAVFDDPLNGGNGDGWIDALDTIYSHLLLWVDTDHDGVSQPEELSTLAANGIVGVSTEYGTSQRRDVHGNLFRYRAPVRRDGGAGDRMAWDVFFKVLGTGDG